MAMRVQFVVERVDRWQQLLHCNHVDNITCMTKMFKCVDLVLLVVIGEWKRDKSNIVGDLIESDACRWFILIVQMRLRLRLHVHESV